MAGIDTRALRRDLADIDDKLHREQMARGRDDEQEAEAERRAITKAAGRILADYAAALEQRLAPLALPPEPWRIG